MLQGYIIYQPPDVEIVRAINYQVSTFNQAFDVRIVYVSNHALYINSRVNLLQMALRRYCLGQLLLYIILVEKKLTLQVVVFDKITVDDPHLSHTGTNQSTGTYGTQRPATGNNHEAIR